jgi:hypothetical protein
MELEIIQARALLAPVLGNRYEDCENGNHKSHSGEDAQASKNTGTNAQPQTDAQLTEEERQIVEECVHETGKYALMNKLINFIILFLSGYLH